LFYLSNKAINTFLLFYKNQAPNLWISRIRKGRVKELGLHLKQSKSRIRISGLESKGISLLKGISRTLGNVLRLLPCPERTLENLFKQVLA